MDALDDPLEKTIEARVCAHAKRRGWYSRKFVSPGNRSVPDRIFMRDGDMFFIEFKRLGRKATEAQKHEHTKIRAEGFNVFIVDSAGAGVCLFDRIELEGMPTC